MIDQWIWGVYPVTQQILGATNDQVKPVEPVSLGEQRAAHTKRMSFSMSTIALHHFRYFRTHISPYL